MVIFAAWLMLTVITSGCGGDNAGDSETAETVETGRSGHSVLTVSSYSVPRYVARANEYCEESLPRMLDSFARYRKEELPRMSESEIFAEGSQNIFLAGIQFWYDYISWVGVPKEEGDAFEHMLDTLQLDIYSGQEQRITSTEQLARLFDDFNAEAQRLGVTNCLVEPSSFEA